MKNNYIDTISEIVNLSAYGSSKMWVGYCEENGTYSTLAAEKAIKCFIDFFMSYLDDFVIVTSVFIDVDNKELFDIPMSKDVLIAENKLIDSGYINQLYLSEYYDNDLRFDQIINDLNMKFTLIESSDERLYAYFSKIIMCDSHIAIGTGHCFFVSRKNDIIIYPHDNIGFGCLAIKDKANNIGFKFLEYMKDNGFVCSYSI